MIGKRLPNIGNNNLHPTIQKVNMVRSNYMESGSMQQLPHASQFNSSIDWLESLSYKSPVYMLSGTQKNTNWRPWLMEEQSLSQLLYLERRYLVKSVQFQHIQAQQIFQTHQSQCIHILDIVQHLLVASYRSKNAEQVIFQRIFHLPILKKNTCSNLSCHITNKMKW